LKRSEVMKLRTFFLRQKKSPVTYCAAVAVVSAVALLLTLLSSAFGSLAAAAPTAMPGPTVVDSMIIRLTDGGAPAKPLSSAEFEVYEIVGSGSADALVDGFVYDADVGVYLYDAASPGRVTAIVTGADGILHIYGLPDGDYYFLETKAPANYILPAGDAAMTLFTVDGTSGTGGVIDGTPGSNAAVGGDFAFDAGNDYAVKTSVSGNWRFTIKDIDDPGSDIPVSCAHIAMDAPKDDDPLTINGLRDNSISALAQALSLEISSGLDDTAWKMFFALPINDTPLLTETAFTSMRAGYMQMYIWLYELQQLYPTLDTRAPKIHGLNSWKQPDDPNGVPSSYVTSFSSVNLGARLTKPNSFPHFPSWEQYYHMLKLFEEMLTQYNARKTTSLMFSFDENTKVISFDHDGYVPHGTSGFHDGVTQVDGIGTAGEEVYDAYLSWPQTPGLSITINGGAAIYDAGTGVSVKKTDVIEVDYFGRDDVVFSLADKQHYLVPDTIKGVLLSSGSAFQGTLLGNANFVTLSSSLTINGNTTIHDIMNAMIVPSNPWIPPTIPTPVVPVTPTEKTEPEPTPDITTPETEPPEEPTVTEPIPEPVDPPVRTDPPAPAPGQIMVLNEYGEYEIFSENNNTTPLGKWKYDTDMAEWIYVEYPLSELPTTGVFDIIREGYLILVPALILIIVGLLFVPKKRSRE